MKLDASWIRKWRFLPQLRLILRLAVIILVLPCMTAEKLYAQQADVAQSQKSIRGKITDETGNPLQGVSVTVKGSSKGVVTNEKGEYNIEVSESSSKTLAFSYVGMELQEVKIGTQKELNISLTPSVTEQQEVVVVGYGSQK